MKAHAASLLILDGLVAAEEVPPTERAFKEFIHEFQATAAMIGCTTLLLTTGAGKGLKAEPTMVDGLFILRERTFGVRAVRELTVRKFQGSGHFRGRHSFAITERGLTVFPCLEALVRGAVVLGRSADLLRARAEVRLSYRLRGSRSVDGGVQSGRRSGEEARVQRWAVSLAASSTQS